MIREKIEKIDWTTKYLMMAIITSMRSDDAQTKCGCVIVSKDNTVISSGYNGYVRGADAEKLPNTREGGKYPFMIHAEHNALLNCARQGVSTLGATAYITGKPCLSCWQYMIQAGIECATYTNYSLPKMTCDNNEDYLTLFSSIKEGSGIMYQFVEIEKVLKTFYGQLPEWTKESI